MHCRHKQRRSGEAIICVFRNEERQVCAGIRNGKLQDSLVDIARQLGLQSSLSDSSDLDLVDSGGFSVTGSLLHGKRYYILCTEAAAADEALAQHSDGAVASSAASVDTSLVWAYDRRVLRHAMQAQNSPESPYRLEKAVLTLQNSRRAREMLPRELGGSELSPRGGEETSSAKAGSCRPIMLAARLASADEILAFHRAHVYRDFITDGTPLPDLPTDVYCNGRRSSDAARLSCGAVIDTGVRVLRTVIQARSSHAKAPTCAPLCGFCLVRPPGHHCCADKPKGFCLVNNVAVGATQLLQRPWDGLDGPPSAPPSPRASMPYAGHREPRIAIVDLDVHFGEGTASFVDGYDAKTSLSHPLLYLSLHRYDGGNFYPFDARGACSYRGDRHPGCIVNVAVDTRAQDDEQCYKVISDHLFSRVMTRVFLPRLACFRPDLIYVSLGFDSAYGDPLGKMAVEGGFAQALCTLKQWCLRGPADAPGQCECARPVGLVAVLEGGYSPEAVSEGVLGVAHALSFSADDADVRRHCRARVPATWEDVRARARRRGQDAQKDHSEGAHHHARSQCLSDEHLMHKHREWCEEVCDRSVIDAPAPQQSHTHA